MHLYIIILNLNFNYIGLLVNTFIIFCLFLEGILNKLTKNKSPDVSDEQISINMLAFKTL